jgi:D-glycero-alpha-D-manno-heptose 1-phosphate guanylyltransferase
MTHRFSGEFANSVRRYTDAYDENTSAVMLVGGRGERLRSVLPSTPKPLASLGNRSFLELLVRQLRCQRIRRLVMCTGYLADQIEREFGDGHLFDVAIQYSKELSPLGTGGALKLAQLHLQETSDFLVMNGDSFLEIDFRQLIRFHREYGGLVSLAVSAVQDSRRYGTVEVGAHRRVMGFREKTGSGTAGLINAGVYVFNRAVFGSIPDGPSSLERDIFPKVLDQGVYAFEQNGMFIDIGTPEDYARAQQLCHRLYDKACPAKSGAVSECAPS